MTAARAAAPYRPNNDGLRRNALATIGATATKSRAESLAARGSAQFTEILRDVDGLLYGRLRVDERSLRGASGTGRVGILVRITADELRTRLELTGAEAEQTAAADWLGAVALLETRHPRDEPDDVEIVDAAATTETPQPTPAPPPPTQAEPRRAAWWRRGGRPTP